MNLVPLATVCGTTMAEAVYAVAVVTAAFMSVTFDAVPDKVPSSGLNVVVIPVPQMLIVAPLRSSMSSLLKVIFIFANLWEKTSGTASSVTPDVVVAHSKSLFL